MNPLVSIIVPVYNVENHIHKCLNSLLHQTYNNYEILLVNDGSTDKSGIICDDYQRSFSNIKVFHLDNNGVSSARNFGIEQCDGEFIQFVDSDDFVTENYIKNMIDYIKPNTDIVIGGINVYTKNQMKYSLISQLKTNKSGNYYKNNLGDVFDNLLDNAYINYCYGKLYRKSVLIKNKIRFKENMSLGEDTIFVLDVLRVSENIYICESAHYNYLIHGYSSLTYKYRQDKFNILNDLIKVIHSFCIQENYISERVESSLDKRFVELVKFCLDEHLRPKSNYKITDRLERITGILNHPDLREFFAKEKPIFKQYPKLIINGIKSRNAMIYVFNYFLIILFRKLRRVK